MSSYYEKQALCEAKFQELGECHHLWTPEKHEIIFTNQSDFRFGMTYLGIASRLYPDVKILTFELMSNHIHITAASGHDRLLCLFDTFKILLQKWLKAEGRTTSLDMFQAGTRHLITLDDLRNVIIYDNRNGFVVCPEHTPFTYPWGANRFYFSPDTCRLAELYSKPFSLRERRFVSHSRVADKAEGLLCFEGCALPLSFCDIRTGETLFRDASHYFNMLAKNIENNTAIAKEIGESIWYTDDELFAMLKKTCRERFETSSPAAVTPAAKIELAKMLHYEYNAGAKQIQRMLKLDLSVINALGII